MQTLRLPFALGCALLLGMGCIAVKQPNVELDPGAIPPGNAVLFLATAVTSPPPGQNTLKVAIGDSILLPLRLQTLNRIYLAEGWYGFKVEGGEAREPGSQVSYRFDAGHIYRFALVARFGLSAEDTSTTTDRGTHYQVVPVTRDALNELLRSTAYPTVDVAY